MYYLNSRYYDPEIGRFINADGYVSTGQGLSGHNMFVYCGNNPVNRTDPSGQFFVQAILPKFHFVIGKIANKVAQFTVKVMADIKNFDLKNTDEEKVLDANYFSAYKGHIALKHPFEEASSFSYAGVMVINKKYVRDNKGNYSGDDINTIRHEYGHCKQYERMGIVKYTLYAFLPSLYSYWSGVDYDDYYSLSWEYEADLLGGVTNRKNTEEKDYEYKYWAYDAYKQYLEFTS